MMNYSTIFWDSLWYFKLNDLEYDFMLPYFYKLEQIKPYTEFDVTLEDNVENNINNIIITDNTSNKFEKNRLKISNNFNFTVFK